ncbi:MAG: ADP-ribosylglycohydrolase family protein [Sulfurimonas sp.]|nr:ADP-ribosylglycohydrolase family protein [Sulfurimonas sp.]
MNTAKIHNSVKATLVADSYLLGSHWVYNASALEALDINWQELNAPYAMWHKGKEKGDFTHYGDHAQHLLKFVQTTQDFKINDYAPKWLEMMKDYKGYIDGSCRTTLEILEEDISRTRCATSSDLSIVGRIAALLYVSDTKDDFLSNVEDFVAFTHNDEEVLKVASYFASVLYDVIKGSNIKDALASTKIDASLKEAFNAAKLSQNEPTLETIYKFGPACSVGEGFKGALHLLFKYDNYKEAMIANAKAGGDSSARGMIVAMLMGANDCDVPQSWVDGTKGL